MAFNWAYNTRDFKFILQEWLPTERVFAYECFRDYYSKDDIDMIIDPVFKIAKEIMLIILTIAFMLVKWLLPGIIL